MILNKEVFKITTDKSQTCEAIKFYSPIAIQVSQTIIPENSIKIPDKIALNYIDDIQEAINKYKSELVTYIDDEQLSQNILSKRYTDKRWEYKCGVLELQKLLYSIRKRT